MASGERAAGAAVFAGIEGSRPVLVEFQALVAPSAYDKLRDRPNPHHEDELVELALKHLADAHPGMEYEREHILFMAY